MKDDKEIICPFCGDSGYDLLGLKIHIEGKWCESYNKIDLNEFYREHYEKSISVPK